MADDPLNRPFILCVDDEPGIVRSLKRILKTEQVNVVTAASGQEALGILGAQGVALILTDYRMPEMNGIEFLEHAALLCPDAFRIILTGYAEAHVLIDAVNRGQIYKILYKPFQEEDIKLTVRSGLEHHAKNCENRALLKELEERNKQLAVLNHTLQLGLEGTQADLTISSTALGMAQQLLNEIPAAVMGIEPSGQIVFANKMANTWFAPPGASRLFSLVGSWSSDLLPESVQESIEEKISDLSRIEPTHLRVQIKPELTLQISCQTLTNGMGRESQATTVFIFATETAAASLPL